MGHFPQSIPKDLMNVISTESWHCLSLDVEFPFWIRRNGEPVEPAAKMVQKCTRNNNRECIYRDVIASTRKLEFTLSCRGHLERSLQDFVNWKSLVTRGGNEVHKLFHQPPLDRCIWTMRRLFYWDKFQHG